MIFTATKDFILAGQLVQKGEIIDSDMSQVSGLERKGLIVPVLALYGDAEEVQIVECDPADKIQKELNSSNHYEISTSVGDLDLLEGESFEVNGETPKVERTRRRKAKQKDINLQDQTLVDLADKIKG